MTRGAFIALALSAFISACATSGGNVSGRAAGACSCNTYFDGGARPDWVLAGDRITAQSYSTAGSANCTGVQTYDVEKAAISARSKLSRMLAVNSNVRISETRKDYGGGPGYTQASIAATQISQTLMKDSKVSGFWVDPENCLVYARADISTARIREQRAEMARQDAARLLNKSFKVTADGPYASILIGQGKSALSAAGVRRMSDAANHKLALSFTPTQNGENELRGILEARIEDNAGAVLWSHTLNAKGVSFQPRSAADMTARAITDAMRRLRGPLSIRLMK